MLGDVVKCSVNKNHAQVGITIDLQICPYYNLQEISHEAI